MKMISDRDRKCDRIGHEHARKIILYCIQLFAASIIFRVCKYHRCIMLFGGERHILRSTITHLILSKVK